MEYVIIFLLVVVLIISIISMTKNINEANITERLGKLELNINKDMSSLKDSLNKDFKSLSLENEKRLLEINEKVNERLDYNFEKTKK